MNTLCSRHTFLHSLQCGSRQNQVAAALDEQGETEHSPPDIFFSESNVDGLQERMKPT